MLTPIGEPLPHDLQDPRYHILETLQGLGVEQQMNLACRTLLAVLLMRRPDPSAPKPQRNAFKTLCAELQVWLKDEIAARRTQPTPEIAAPKGTSRLKVAHA
jgi:hypothetical protein